MFDLVAQFMIDAGNAIMQTSTGSVGLDSAVSILGYVAVIAGVIGGFAKMWTKTRGVGQMLDTFSQKAVENDEVIRRAMSAVVETIPEVNSHLQKYELPLSKIEERVKIGAEQLVKFRDSTVTGSMRSNTITDMPREKSKMMTELS